MNTSYITTEGEWRYKDVSLITWRREGSRKTGSVLAVHWTFHNYQMKWNEMQINSLCEHPSFSMF
jgi:hypothetical protein